MTYAKGRLTYFPALAADRIHWTFEGADPITLTESAELQATNGYPVGFYCHMDYRTKFTPGKKGDPNKWTTTWTCFAEPSKGAK
jgi:hypothetical protein